MATYDRTKWVIQAPKDATKVEKIKIYVNDREEMCEELVDLYNSLNSDEWKSSTKKWNAGIKSVRAELGKILLNHGYNPRSVKLDEV